jgi:hypothetical protein
MSHGGLTRARSWKRRIQPKEAYSSPGLLYSEAFANAFHENAGGCQVNFDFVFVFLVFAFLRFNLSSLAERFCRAARSSQGRAGGWARRSEPLTARTALPSFRWEGR